MQQKQWLEIYSCIKCICQKRFLVGFQALLARKYIYTHTNLCIYCLQHQRITTWITLTSSPCLCVTFPSNGEKPGPTHLIVKFLDTRIVVSELLTFTYMGINLQYSPYTQFLLPLFVRISLSYLGQHISFHSTPSLNV